MRRPLVISLISLNLNNNIKPMGLLNTIVRLLGFGCRFNGTAEQYLAMVRYMAQKNNPV